MGELPTASLEGRYKILLSLVIIIMVLGISATIFDPEAGYVDSFGDVQSLKDSQDTVNDDWWTQATGGFSFIATAFSIFFRGLFLDIPFIPLILKIFIVTPMLIMLSIVLFEILLDIINGVKNFTSIFKPL
jgi:hypothetical protein